MDTDENPYKAPQTADIRQPKLPWYARCEISWQEALVVSAIAFFGTVAYLWWDGLFAR